MSNLGLRSNLCALRLKNVTKKLFPYTSRRYQIYYLYVYDDGQASHTTYTHSCLLSHKLFIRAPVGQTVPSNHTQRAKAR